MAYLINFFHFSLCVNTLQNCHLDLNFLFGVSSYPVFLTMFRNYSSFVVFSFSFFFYDILDSEDLTITRVWKIPLFRVIMIIVCSITSLSDDRSYIQHLTSLTYLYTVYRLY